MSFEFNNIGASSFKPKVENTFLSKGGGGGNTGYFRQKKKKQNGDDASILSGYLDSDTLDKKVLDQYNAFENEESLLGKVKGFLGL